MKLGAAFVQTLLLQVLQSALSIGTGVLVARALGPSGQGVYAAVVATVALGSQVVSLGQYQEHTLLAARPAVSARHLLLRTLLHTALVVGLALATIALWRPALGLDGRMAALFAVVLGLEVAALLVRGINLGRQQILLFNLTPFAQRLFLLLGVAGALLATGRLTPERVVVAWIAATGLSVLASAIWVWRTSSSAPLDWRALSAGWRGSLRQGGRVLAVIGLTLALVRCDVWMLRPMLGVAAVGQVSVAYGLAEWLWYVPSIINSLLFAAVAADRGAATIAKLARASRLVAAASLAGVVALLAVGKWIVLLLYGHQYAVAADVFVWLAPGMAAIAIHLVVDSYFAGTGFPPVTIWGAGGALMAKVLLNLALVPAMGVRGAALATTIAYGGLLALKLGWFRRTTGVPVASLLLMRPDDARHALALVGSRLRARRSPAESPRANRAA